MSEETEHIKLLKDLAAEARHWFIRAEQEKHVLAYALDKIPQSEKKATSDELAKIAERLMHTYGLPVADARLVMLEAMKEKKE